MRMIGILGGMSWESSAHYYALINRAVRAQLGAPHSARILMHSFDFGEIAALQAAGEWERLGLIMAEAGRALEAGGADGLVLATNTMHKLAPAIEAACTIPLLHIADAAAARIKADGLDRLALLGTAFTMEEAFYRDRLAQDHGLEILIPDAEARAQVHRVIYEELIAGTICEASRAAYRGIIARMIARGAQGIILGCTEIMLLIDQSDSAAPLYDTTALHCEAAAQFALGG